MTTEKPAALIVTTRADEATDSVVARLAEHDSFDVFRLNTEELPQAASASMWIGERGSRDCWQINGRSVSFDRVRRVWFRRHRLPLLASEPEPAHKEYCLREALWMVRGLLFSLDRFVAPEDWMSHPSTINRAESKIAQLTASKALGLVAPRTLVSNNPRHIREFWSECGGQMVAKPLKMGYFDYGHEQRATYTTKLEQEHLTDDGALTAAPVIYQQLVPKRCDVRVTIVRDKIYAASIDSQREPSAHVDWRRSEIELEHAVHVLPEAVRIACQRLMHALGLRFGALDFALTPAGEYVFLEINPSGQWLWLEDKLGFPISEQIASWLVGASR